MRLIDAKTLELRDFYLAEIPPYAILSHTWDRDEVAFKDMASPERHSKEGYVSLGLASSVGAETTASGVSRRFIWKLGNHYGF